VAVIALGEQFPIDVCFLLGRSLTCYVVVREKYCGAMRSNRILQFVD